MRFDIKQQAMQTCDLQGKVKLRLTCDYLILLPKSFQTAVVRSRERERGPK